MAEPGQSGDVELDLIGEPIGIELGEHSVVAEPGVVHDQVDRLARRADPLGDSLLTLGGQQVGDQHVDAVELVSDRLQTIGAASHDDDRHTLTRQLAGHHLTDAG
jgi:hypothetical protein